VYTLVPLSPSQAVAEFVKHLTGAQARERLAKAGYTAPQ
jgi:hypothetical protein